MNELPSHPSELSVSYIIGDILGSPRVDCAMRGPAAVSPSSFAIYQAGSFVARRSEKFVNFFLRRVTCPRTRVRAREKVLIKTCRVSIRDVTPTLRRPSPPRPPSLSVLHSASPSHTFDPSSPPLPLSSHPPLTYT